jgi:Delta24-sterol reductase
MGNHWLFRWLLGWLMPPRVSALKLSMTPKMIEYYNSKFVAQDILVPAAKTGECMELMHDIFEIYPLWLCAHKVIRTRMGTMLDVEPDYDNRAIHLQGDTADAQMYVDVGIWSTPTPILRGEEYNLEAAVDAMEAWLIDNHGYQALYAVTQLTEQDFWRMFDKKLYKQVRLKYGGETAFFDVYRKVGKR